MYLGPELLQPKAVGSSSSYEGTTSSSRVTSPLTPLLMLR